MGHADHQCKYRLQYGLRSIGYARYGWLRWIRVGKTFTVATNQWWSKRYGTAGAIIAGLCGVILRWANHLQCWFVPVDWRTVGIWAWKYLRSLLANVNSACRSITVRYSPNTIPFHSIFGRQVIVAVPCAPIYALAGGIPPYAKWHISSVDEQITEFNTNF